MTIKVKVTPRAARTEIAGTMADGTLKVKVAAPPEGGRANEELCRFLAEYYGVARSEVSVISGMTATRKLVRVG